MSAAPQLDTTAARRTPVTVTTLHEAKRTGVKLVMLTAYDYPSAVVAERAGVDLVLVGDSAATTVFGLDSTVPATTEQLLLLSAAVRRGLDATFMVSDLPFGSYEASDYEAVKTAQQFVKEAGAQAVKVEGGGTIVDRVRAIVNSGIAVFGHLGLTPQTESALGGLRAQGKNAEQALRLTRDALALQEAGCTAIVFEAIPSEIADAVVPLLDVPVIGIGAGSGTDGQVLVWHDLLGLLDGRTAKFVKQYASLRDDMASAVSAFGDEVRSGQFPTAAHTYGIGADELRRFRAELPVLLSPETEAAGNAH